MTTGYRRPLPALDDLNRSFWTGGRDGALTLLKCHDCSFWIHPPQPRCPKCLSAHVKPAVASGRGIVHSFTINVKPWGPGMKVPFVLAQITLPEQPGLLMVSNVVDVDAEAVEIGMEVAVTFEQDEDIWMPLFRPV